MPNWNSLREARMGVMLHYDASTSDKGAVEWLLHDPRCKVSYNYLVLDNGQIVTIAPADARAWHAGICRPSEPRLNYRDANSALWGISIAATVGEVATKEAKEAIADLTRILFINQHWPLTDTWRIVGHSSEAWPRGRKIDPVGPNPAKPVLSVEEMRDTVTGGIFAGR